ncbi:MAG: outer membrane beta-barrel domain-containing protein [Halobacteriovoraceae bacterium]|nr:outer membrane beta-barrel domain-containing protein [Halobacteriovoraceae bacterium]
MKRIILFFILFVWIIPRVYAAESDLYKFLWLDPDKKVYVLQNKVFRKKGTIYFDVSALIGLSSDFQNTTGFQIKPGFFFTEEFGIELKYSMYQNSDNTALKEVQRAAEVMPFIRRINTSMGGYFIWSPFYGKINTFNKIFYFDWYFGAGFGILQAESNKTSAADSSAETIYETESYNALMLKMALRFYLNKNWHIGLELQNDWYKAPGVLSGEKTRTNVDTMLNFGFRF